MYSLYNMNELDWKDTVLDPEICVDCGRRQADKEQPTCRQCCEELNAE